MENIDGRSIVAGHGYQFACINPVKYLELAQDTLVHLLRYCPLVPWLNKQSAPGLD